MMTRGNEGKSPLNCDVGMHPYSSDGGDDTGTGTSFLGYSLTNIHGDGGVPLPRTDFRASGCVDFERGGGGMGGKCILSVSQWEELERQKMIHKYIMASIPVPPHLLLFTGPSPSPSLPYSNNCLELRYSSGGSDAEPWRCKRTDGKKWRCSRDVAPDQKYCDRHAHKSKPRSRKHVEASPHSNHLIPHQQQPTLQPPLVPRMESAASHDQSRCIEWFIRGAATNSSKELKSSNLGGSKIGSLETNDGWDNRVLDGLTNNTKLSPNSLTLSMPVIEDNQDSSSSSSSYIGMIMMNSGGPLGEALCLGNGTRGGGMNVASPHHSGSKSSSCEDDSHALNFIG